MCVDIGLPHLDRLFDYLVSVEHERTAMPGCRVRIRFAGQLVAGFVLERVERSDHSGRLLFVERVVSAEPILHPEIAKLSRDIADRYAGTLADILRLAVPPRHAKVEQETVTSHTGEPPGWRPGGWSRYQSGASFIRALSEGRSPRAVWSALPGDSWPQRLAETAAAAYTSGRGCVIVVPDTRDVERVDSALISALGGSHHHVALSAALGPAERYRRFLTVSRGQVKIVVGTRSAAFAPVSHLGLVAIWDDGDDVHAEPRAPYPHTRAILLSRADNTGCAALIGSYSRSAESQQLIEVGWAREIVGERQTIRLCAPRVIPTTDDVHVARDAGAASARLPSSAWKAAHNALAAETPVLVQVPRRGYIPAVGCARCHEPARCIHCSGPMALPSVGAPPTCRWCGRPSAAHTCPHCGSRTLRAAVVGAKRTAEELARAFPGVPVKTSGRDGMLAQVDAGPGLVVATPGAEPVAMGGYGAVLLLDTWALLTRADLRATEETLRRWLGAASLARPSKDGGTVVVVCDGALAPVQALIRFDPGWLAALELAHRRSLGFPPAVRMATITGTAEAVADFLQVAELPASTRLLGPVPAGDERERMLLRVPRSLGRDLALALRRASGVRGARKAPDPVCVRIDPLDLV